MDHACPHVGRPQLTVGGPRKRSVVGKECTGTSADRVTRVPSRASSIWNEKSAKPSQIGTGASQIGQCVSACNVPERE